MAQFGQVDVTVPGAERPSSGASPTWRRVGGLPCQAPVRQDLLRTERVVEDGRRAYRRIVAEPLIQMGTVLDRLDISGRDKPLLRRCRIASLKWAGWRSKSLGGAARGHSVDSVNQRKGQTMSDPIKELSESGWIAEHRKLYLEDGVAGHMWDSTVGGGPGPLPTLLLFTTGRKSGQESIMPLLYDKVESGYAIIASKGGFPTHPGWYHNLRAQPEVKVKVANDEFGATARVATGAERERIWAQMAEMYPPYSDYAKAASPREIPVVVLEPKG